MQFTGANLDLVLEALEELENQLNNMIATCPDTELYSDKLEGYELKLAKVRRLQKRITGADHLGRGYRYAIPT